jgi:hypothetical protein
MPPACIQSAWFVYLLKSPDTPEGLADGDEDEPLDDPPVAPGDVGVPLPGVPESEPVVPEGLPVPEGLLAPGADEPLPVCAAARAGIRATNATRSVSISFCIFFLPFSDLPSGPVPEGCSSPQQDPGPHEQVVSRPQGKAGRALIGRLSRSELRRGAPYCVK